MPSNWLIFKLSFNWNEVDTFKEVIMQTINTGSLRFRYQMILAIKQLQTLLELTNLGRVNHQCLKHANGSVFFVIAKDVHQIDKNNSSLLSQSLKFNEIQKLLLKSNSVKSSNFFKEIEHISLFKNLKVTFRSFR